MIPFVHAQWDLTLLPDCECGAHEQTADHVLTAGPTTCIGHDMELRGLIVLDDKTRCWLNTITVSICPDSAAAWDNIRVKLWPHPCLCLNQS